MSDPKKRKIFEKVPEKLDETVFKKESVINHDPINEILIENITISKKEYDDLLNEIMYYKELVSSMTRIEEISNSLIKIFKEKIARNK